MSRTGSLVDLVVPSRALRRDCEVTLYLPARFRRTARYPLLIVHDGSDYLRYASATTVLDNLIHRLDVAEMIVAFVSPADRLVEYANSAAHARYLTAELVPRLEAEFPLAAVPSARCLMGASFGAVAAAIDRLPVRGRLRLAAVAVRLVRLYRHRQRPRRRAGCSSRWCGSSTGIAPLPAESLTGCL